MVKWAKERQLIWKIWKWWFYLGLICIPFGFVYGELRIRLHYESKLALVACVAAALICNYVIQGMPPDE